MKQKDAFPSDYLKSDDVSGMGETYTIDDLTIEEFKDPKTQEVDKKPVLWFKEIKKGLILNKTNWSRIATTLGDESDTWTDKTLNLRLEAVEAFGKKQDVIRIA